MRNKNDLCAPLIGWLRESALPLWSDVGVDRVGGGFFEKIDLRGSPVEEPRRSRVVARQIYVFGTAAERGWLRGAEALVDHGLEFLLTRLRREDGTFASSVRPDGTLVDGRFDLYEQAFVLFALAVAYRVRPDRRARLREEASALRATLKRGCSHPSLGFEESNPRTLPLRSNPHMHLLEAALEWSEIADEANDGAWDGFVDDLVNLCMTRFIDGKTGALREHFDGDWNPMHDRSGTLVEPGHQFEWSWLLTRWARSRGSQAAMTAASRLLAIGEDHGVDRRRNVAVDELDDDLALVSDTAKLWPQTERVKAWDAACRVARGTDEMASSQRHLQRAVDGLSQYFLSSPAGLWHEQMRADGSFVLQDCRASSLYHIVCAIDTMSRVDADQERTTSL